MVITVARLRDTGDIILSCADHVLPACDRHTYERKTGKKENHEANEKHQRSLIDIDILLIGDTFEHTRRPYPCDRFPCKPDDRERGRRADGGGKSR